MKSPAINPKIKPVKLALFYLLDIAANEEDYELCKPIDQEEEDYLPSSLK